MRKYDELTEVEQAKALDRQWSQIMQSIVEGSIRFNDEANDDNLQATIDSAWEEAERMHTPWLAGEIIRDAVYTGIGDEKQTVGELVTGMAQCEVEDALYPDSDEIIIRL